MIHNSLIGRRAQPGDIPSIRRMQERSIRELGTDHYSIEEIDAFLGLFSTMDDKVVDEGHYFVLLTPEQRIVASAGWSQLPPGYSRGTESYDAQAATIRSVFVDGDYSRRGLGRRIMEMVESDAAAAGIAHLKVSSTLSGVALYKALGYAEVERKVLEIGAFGFELVRMEKPLAGGDRTSNENGLDNPHAAGDLRGVPRR